MKVYSSPLCGERNMDFFIGSVLDRDGGGVDVFRYDNTDDFSLVVTGRRGGIITNINLGKLQGRALARLLNMEDYE